MRAWTLPLRWTAVGLAVLTLACLSTDPGPRLGHFPEAAPAPGEPLPDLEVLTLGGERVALEGLLGERPVVLQVGSVSCPVFRYRRYGIERLARELGDRVTFVVLYTREAHPVGSPSPYTLEEWDPWINRLTGVRVPAAETEEERRRRPETVRRRLDLTPLVVVDPGQDLGWQALGRAPSPFIRSRASGPRTGTSSLPTSATTWGKRSATTAAIAAALALPALACAAELPDPGTIQGDPVVTLLPPDAIPAIDDPEFVAAGKVRFLQDDEPILGVVHDGVAKAYSLWHLDRHEIVNDRLGDTPIAATRTPSPSRSRPTSGSRTSAGAPPPTPTTTGIRRRSASRAPRTRIPACRARPWSSA